MKITYHTEVEKPVNVTLQVNHVVLNKEIQDYLEDKGARQRYYFINDNARMFFIYLNCGDRVDVQY